MKGRRKFLGHWENKLGLFLVLVFLAGAIFAPLISPQDKKEPGPFKQVGSASDFYPHPPSQDAILGTLPGQYDVFHTLVWGMRDAMMFGLLVAVSSFLVGIFFGSLSGYAGGLINSLMMRIADAFLTFPILAGVVFLQQLIGMTVNAMGGWFYFNAGTLGKIVYFAEEPTPLMSFLVYKLDPVMITLILFSWVPYARLVNSIVLTLRQTDFIQAARALGGSPLWIIRRHLIPNSIGPALVLGARDVGGAVILQATITFIGLGGTSPWGTLLSMGRNYVLGAGGSLFTHWWVYLPVTLAVILFGVSWNLVGDGLNDMLSSSAQTEYRHPFWKRKKEKESPVAGEEVLVPVSAIASPSNQPHDGYPHPIFIRKSSVESANAVLLAARENISHGDLPRALHAYDHLIRHDRLVDQVVVDLARIIKLYPQNALLWQTMGDALSRTGDQKHAAESYERACKYAE